MDNHLIKTGRFTPWLYLFPAFLLIFFFQVIPILYALVISFFRTDLVGPWTWVGLKNYMHVFQDKAFWKSIGVTFYYVGVSIPLNMMISICLAVLINSKIRAKAAFRTAYFLPYITSTAAVALVWLWIYNAKPYGLLNFILDKISFGLIEPVRWLEDPHWALPAVILMLIWKNLGFNVIILLTRLQNIDQHFYEASSIDGANPLQQFKKITWPLLRPTLLFLSTMSTILAFKLFPSIYVLTPLGGPRGSTTTAVFYFYQLAWDDFRMGYAASAAYMIFLIILLITMIQRRILKLSKDVEY